MTWREARLRIRHDATHLGVSARIRQTEKGKCLTKTSTRNKIGEKVRPLKLRIVEKQACFVENGLER